MFKSLCLLLCIISLPLAAATLEGQYKVNGRDPYTKKSYTGVAQIKRAGDKIYHAAWTIPGASESYFGTGFVEGDSLVFVFKGTSAEDPARVGMQHYQIGNGKLQGTWIYFDGDKKGSETLVKMH